MIDKEKLPEQIYNELIELLGYEKAEKFLNKAKYNFQTIQIWILFEKMRRKFDKGFWNYFWVIVSIFVIIYVFVNF